MTQNTQSKMRALRLVGIVIAATIVLLAAGTRNYTELHERLIIRGLGIDRTDEGYKISLHALKTSEENTTELFTTEGKSVYDALENLGLVTDKVPLYSHSFLVVIGREAAEHGVDDVVDFFIRYQETRPTESIFLANDTAGELFEHQKDGQYDLTLDINESASGRQNHSRLIQMELLDVVNAMYRNSNAVHLPVLSIDDGQIREYGTGIFENSQLKEMLDLEQTRGLSAALGKLQGGTEVVEGPGGLPVTLQYSQCRPKIKAEIQNGKPVFTLSVDCKANLSQTSTPVTQQMEKEVFTELEQALSDKLRGQMERTLRWAVLENHCDVFGFSNALLHQQTDYWRAHEDTWIEEMAEADYRISVKSTIALEGKETSPKPFNVW